MGKKEEFVLYLSPSDVEKLKALQKNYKCKTEEATLKFLVKKEIRRAKKEGLF